MSICTPAVSLSMSSQPLMKAGLVHDRTLHSSPGPDTQRAPAASGPASLCRLPSAGFTGPHSSSAVFSQQGLAENVDNSN